MIIYRALSKTTGKSYIGQTIRSLKERKAEHLRAAQQIGRRETPLPIHVAIRELGSGDFNWTILEDCSSAAHLNDREIFYITLLDTVIPNGYNSTKGGHMDGDMSKEIRDKIAASMREVHKDPEYRARVYPKLKGLIPPNKGIPMSAQQKRKVSAARKAVYEEPAYTNPNIGQKREAEALANLRSAYEIRQLPTGGDWAKVHANQFTPEVKAKMSAAKKGKKPINTKKVQCIETGKIFTGLSEVATAMNLPRQSIWMQIKGKLKTVRGFTFKYV